MITGPFGPGGGLIGPFGVVVGVVVGFGVLSSTGSSTTLVSLVRPAAPVSQNVSDTILAPVTNSAVSTAEIATDRVPGTLILPGMIPMAGFVQSPYAQRTNCAPFICTSFHPIVAVPVVKSVRRSAWAITLSIFRAVCIFRERILSVRDPSGIIASKIAVFLDSSVILALN